MTDIHFKTPCDNILLPMMHLTSTEIKAKTEVLNLVDVIGSWRAKEPVTSTPERVGRGGKSG